MKRIVIAGVVIFCLSSCCLAAEFTPVPGLKARLGQASQVYTQIGGEPLDELESGTTVDVIEVRGGWAKVRFIETDLYIPSSVLTATEEQFGSSVAISSTGRTFYLARKCDFTCAQSGLVIGFDAGESVVMLDAEADRAKVLLNGIIGYVPVDAIALTEDFTYVLGLPGDSIKPMQQRLEELGYFDGVADGILGIDTVDAVLRFRYQMGMTDEFDVEGDFREMLYAIDAPDDPIRILSLAPQDAGGAVLRLQKRLMAKGYLVDTATGFYDPMTIQAVSLFQSVERLEQTGLADVDTLGRLFSAEARKLPRNLMPVTSETTIYLPGGVVNADWWTSDIQEVFPREAVALITDVETGLSWHEQRRGGTNHADVQPLTQQDTTIMLSAVGGKWTWDRRPIWVTVGTVRYAASMNCMPHGDGAIQDNGFDGHHCIHFLNSRTHASNRMDERHQLCVSIAAGLADFSELELLQKPEQSPEP